MERFEQSGGTKLNTIQGVRICTYKSLRWLVVLQLVLTPFATPQVSHAQSSNSTPTPACTIKFDNKQPGQLCVPQTLEFKPGDSNATIAEKARQEIIQKRLVASRRAKALALQNVSDQKIKLYPDAGQCIPFARAVSGLSISGTARNVSTNSSEPSVGAVVITGESVAGHAAVVTKVNEDSFEVIERNFDRGWVTKRNIPKLARFIKGFVSPTS